MSLVPLSDLKEWLDIVDVLCRSFAADASNGIIIDPASILPPDFPELQFENNKYTNPSPEYPDIETIRVILMARYQEQRRIAMGA